MAPTPNTIFLFLQTSQKHRTIYRRRCVSPVKKHGFQHKKIENPKNPWDDDLASRADEKQYFLKKCMAPTRDAFFWLWQTSQKHRTIYRRRCVSPVKKHGFQHKKIENPKNPWDDDFCFLRDWGVFFEKRREKREEKRKVRRQERREERRERRERRDKREENREKRIEK